MSKAFITIVFFLMLNGCASLESINYKGEDAGHAVLTTVLGRGSETTATYHITIREVSGQKTYESFSYSPGNLFWGKPSDFSDSEGMGYVHVATLKPGKYEIFSWTALNNNWNATSDEFPPYQFEIKSGQTTYVGAFAFKPFRGRNFFNISVLAGFDFVPVPNIKRDMKIAKTKESSIVDSLVINANNDTQAETK
ncbi:hypothetical protein KJY73_03300 [Bowmanella sp. Y26]|uniref:hypothetical protein n=1 Tax=Bowmanella yangjiangensis TaxID=2811230 RepID=UPI001BDCF2F6|nr:hypothetical protein [Bowmanella yangjiangensis]MBT1062582.1 hypothetical protein [Bowmanella yangjiangensis]